MASAGSVALVLHAHLPWVRHAEHPHFLEEDWLYEAQTETYLPLLAILDRFEAASVDAPLTVALSPTLCEMLADDLLQRRYRARLDALIAIARAVARQHVGSPFEAAAAHQVEALEAARAVYRRHDGRILAGFRHHAARGACLLMTSGATHGFIPLMATTEARRAQIDVATANFKKHFGADPVGIWLPECGYAEGLDLLLARAKLRFFCAETHGVTYARPRPRYGHYRPILTEGGVAVFGRDPAGSNQIWSADTGYPGDPAYREFYRDVGWDGPDSLIEPVIGDGPRRGLGLKLHRVTGDVPLDQKQPYDPTAAAERVASHVEHFVACCAERAARIHDDNRVEPVIVLSFDAELFGHWWHEGPRFLESFLLAVAGRDELELTTPQRWLEHHPVAQIARPAPSSWGRGGYSETWLNGENAWIYRHLHRAEERMVELATLFTHPSELEERALNQAARELMLAQSSDWAFMMSAQTTVPYAIRRTRDHIASFDALYHALVERRVEASEVAAREAKSPLMEASYRVFRPRGRHVPPPGVTSVAI